jgi:hypothetical protein
MGIAGWCKVLGKALDEGNFYKELQKRIVQNFSNSQIKTFVKNEANVTLNDTDIGWLKKKVGTSNNTFLDLIDIARQRGNLDGGSGRK